MRILSIEGRTLYHLHALRAAAAGGIRSLERWLDHVAALGCGGVLLTPIHHSSDHGYDTIDAFRLDPRLGSDSDFESFVGACRERDLVVVLDGVFNHAGRGFVRPELLSDRCWEGHDELVELDHSNPDVLVWAAEVAVHWLDRGASGWRFDVAYSMPRTFLGDLIRRIRQRHPEAFLFGEMIHGDYADLVSSTGLDSVTQYELFKAIWSSLNDANMWELAWALERHRAFASAFPPVTFLGNHDVTRIATNLQNAAHLPIALGVLMTVPGVPCVYYGDEFGWTGRKHRGPRGDDEIRPPLPDAAVWDSTTEQHRNWITFRRERPWLTNAPLEVVGKTNTTLDYRVGAMFVHIDVEHGLTVSEP
ncbi:MAG TPA: alpha-amylase family glycosyl hydrolase [Acidimicrobiales bacterium]|nr:alpha-amylase family glycosyl hydrolase [Acidimicrobiales bacterium]